MSSSEPGLRESLPLPAQGYQTCGKYTLIAKLGHGGMAEVFLALATGMGGFTKLVVVKRIHPQLMEEPEFVTMFMDEARLAARLNHPNVIQTHEVSESGDGLPYIAMEYLDGQSLDKTVRQAKRQGKKVPRDISLAVVAHGLAGLHYAHTLKDFDGTPLNVVHRDISPSNLFITYQGAVKLLDFGIAKAATQLAETRTGRIKGKLSYMAPEQAKGTTVDPRADIWSMGVVLWETLAEQRLFKEDNEVKTIQRVLAADVPPLRGIDSTIPEPLLAIVDKALSMEPKERIGSADEMRLLLEQAAKQHDQVEIASQSRLASYMGELFAEVQAHHEERIRRAIDAFKGGTSATTMPTLPMLAGRLQSARESTPSVDITMNLTPSVEARQTVRSRRTMIVRAGLTVAGFLVAVAIGLAGVHLSRSDDAAEADTAAETSVTPPAAAEARLPHPGTPTPSFMDPPTGEEPGSTPPAPAVEPSPAPAPAAAAEPTSPRELRSEPLSPREGRAERLRRQREARERRENQSLAAANSTPPPPDQERTAPEPPSQATAESGRLSLVTTPWSEVFLGGRRLGTTPLMGVSLPSGSHVLTLRNPEEGVSTSYRVQIAPGGHTRARISLR